MAWRSPAALACFPCPQRVAEAAHTLVKIFRRGKLPSIVVRLLTCALLSASFIGVQAHVIRMRTERRAERIVSCHEVGATPLSGHRARESLGGGTTRAVAGADEAQQLADALPRTPLALSFILGRTAAACQAPPASAPPIEPPLMRRI